MPMRPRAALPEALVGRPGEILEQRAWAALPAAPEQVLAARPGKTLEQRAWAAQPARPGETLEQRAWAEAPVVRRTLDRPRAI